MAYRTSKPLHPTEFGPEDKKFKSDSTKFERGLRREGEFTSSKSKKVRDDYFKVLSDRRGDVEFFEKIGQRRHAKQWAKVGKKKPASSVKRPHTPYR